MTDDATPKKLGYKGQALADCGIFYAPYIYGVDYLESQVWHVDPVSEGPTEIQKRIMEVVRGNRP